MNSKYYLSHPVRSIVSAASQLRLRSVFVLLSVVMGISIAAVAQQATIVGTITDPSGAALPNVNVTVTNLDSNAVKQIQTNASGQFVVPDLNIGHYSVKAELAGFKSSEQKNVVLQVGDRDRIDFQMQVGGIQETVTVEADPVRVQTDTGEQSNVITGQQISQIAVSGRSMYQLAALVPGASSQIGAGGMSSGVVNTPVGGDSGVEFNGMRQNHNIYLLDGGEDDDRGGAGSMSIAPSSDAIAEFRHEWEGVLQPSPHISLPGMPYVQIEALGDSHRIRLAAAHHLHFIRDGDNWAFKADGMLWGGISPDLVPAFEMLNDTNVWGFAELCAPLKSEPAKANLRKMLAALARAGVILIEKP